MSTRQDRITVEALKYYIPLFDQANLAEEVIFERFDELTSVEVAQLQAIASLKSLVVDKIYSLSGPLITREINKILKNSSLKGSEGIFDVLWLAGKYGLEKGLHKFSVDKINSSATNYIFQWITVYAKKELNKMEAPMGIPVSRYEKYKKISAVRNKLSGLLERDATNEEILEYFHTGRADIKNMNGRLKNKNVPSKANQQIRLEDIEEQEIFETYLMNIPTYDPTSDYSANLIMIDDSRNYFDESFIGAFVSEYDFTVDALAVISSEYSDSVKEEYESVLAGLGQKEYKRLLRAWEKLFLDSRGVFYSFVVDNREYNSFFADSYLSNIRKQVVDINKNDYSFLFKGKS